MCKLIGEVTFGVRNSGSLQQSRIARALKESCRDQRKTAQQIARVLPLKHCGRLRRGRRLPAHPERVLSMVVVRHGKHEPLVLITTRAVRGRRRQGERLIQAYPGRWACEEGYRFTKRGLPWRA